METSLLEYYGYCNTAVIRGNNYRQFSYHVVMIIYIFSFRIDVIDSNDNAPKFLRDSYEAYINETIKRGTSFLQVMARDLDEGNNGKVSLNSQ